MPPPAEARDIPQLVALRRDFTYEDDEGDERDEYEADLRAFVDAAIPGDNWRIWVADNNGRVVSHLYTALIAKVPKQPPDRVPDERLHRSRTAPPWDWQQADRCGASSGC